MTYDFKISVYGDKFDIDKFIGSTDLLLSNVHRKGEPINNRKNYNTSGCDIQIIKENQSIDSIGGYIQDFLHNNKNVFRNLKENYLVNRIVLIGHLYFNTDEELALTFGFSSDFHSTLAEFDIDTDFTIWDSKKFENKN